MEEEKAAAYYDELTRKGEGAARFKQGLGFSSSSKPYSDPFPSKPSSLLSSFVPASGLSDPGEPAKPRDPHVLENIQSKLRRSKDDGGRSFGDRERRERRGRSGNDSWEEDERERRYRREEDERERRYRRGDRDRREDRERSYRERRRRSRSSSPSSRVSHSRDRDRRSHRRERDSSPRRKGSENKSAGSVDYSKTPAERVKAKMKLQLSRTAAKDTTMGMSTGWERFDFNKDAPLDDDEEETEVAEDDISLVKDLGKSFRFSAVEAKREEEIKAAHDQAIFGGATPSGSVAHPQVSRSTKEDEKDKKDGDSENHLSSSALISDQVLSMQQGSWRDRARKFQSGSEKN